MANSTVIPDAVITIFTQGKSVTTLMPQRVSVQQHANNKVSVDLDVNGKYMSPDSSVMIRSNDYQQKIEALSVANATAPANTTANAVTTPTPIKSVQNLKLLTVKNIRGSTL